MTKDKNPEKTELGIAILNGIDVHRKEIIPEVLSDHFKNLDEEHQDQLTRILNTVFMIGSICALSEASAATYKLARAIAMTPPALKKPTMPETYCNHMMFARDHLYGMLQPKGEESQEH
jgi:hypothetical protein